MRKTKRVMCSAVACMLLSTTLAQPALAALTKVSSISIGVRETAAEEDGQVYDVEVTAPSSSYEIEDVSFSSDQSEWKPGKKVTCTIELSAKDGYKFDSDLKEKNVSSSLLDIVSVSGDSKEIKVKGNYIPKVKLATPEGLYYDEESSGMVARWDKVEYCKKYEVQLYWDEHYEVTNSDGETEDRTRQKTKNVTVEENKISLNTYATVSDSEISFKVRAIPSTDKDKKYILASDWVDFDGTVTADEESSTYGQFITKDKSITFRGMDGELAKGWQIINGVWYYFDVNNNNNAIVSNWGFINGRWYHFDAQGKMKTGWQFINNRWYFLNTNTTAADYGAMRTGWMQDGPSGPWYYLQVNGTDGNPEGAMLVSCVTPDGYTVNESGIWVP